MAQHTPGPWMAERLRLDGHEWFVKSECRNLPPYNWMPRFSAKIDALMPLKGAYANSRHGLGTSDAECCPIAVAENAANARLIASAPDMLAALKLVAGLDIYHEVLRIVDAAIANAEGRP